jgi:hypothetical protein
VAAAARWWRSPNRTPPTATTYWRCDGRYLSLQVVPRTPTPGETQTGRPARRPAAPRWSPRRAAAGAGRREGGRHPRRATHHRAARDHPVRCSWPPSAPLGPLTRYVHRRERGRCASESRSPTPTGVRPCVHVAAGHRLADLLEDREVDLHLLGEHEPVADLVPPRRSRPSRTGRVSANAPAAPASAISGSTLADATVGSAQPSCPLSRVEAPDRGLRPLGCGHQESRLWRLRDTTHRHDSIVGPTRCMTARGLGGPLNSCC